MIILKMYQLILFFTILMMEAFGASITPIPDKQTVSSEDYSLSSSTPENLQSTAFTPSQPEAPHLPLPQFYYPTYPDYKPSNFSGETSKNHKNELVPSSPPRYVNTWLSTITTNLIPFGSSALSYGVKALVFIFQFAVVSVIGLILTTSLCTFTPFCTISFAGFNLNQNQVKHQVTELARAYITPENLDVATEFAMKAIEKYSQFKSLGQE